MAYSQASVPSPGVVGPVLAYGTVPLTVVVAELVEVGDVVTAAGVGSNGRRMNECCSPGLHHSSTRRSF